MYEQFKSNNVDLIINGGDLTNTDLLHPEENSALSEALSYNPGIQELYVLGNHEIKNKDSSISSVSILNGYPNIEVFNKITLIQKGDCNLLLVPYMADKDKYEEIYSTLSNLDKSVSCYVFSHMSYIGENYNNYIETNGLDKERLIYSYPNIKGIWNGHIHNIRDNGIYHQIGSLVGNSFSDSYSEGNPGIVILDTNTNNFIRIPNPYAILFHKMECESIRSLTSKLGKLDKNTGKCIRVEVPSSIKDNIYEYIEQNKNKYNIHEYRIKAKYEKVNNSVNTNETESLSHYRSPYDALKGFIDVQSSLPYEKSDMIKFLDTYIGGTT
jgi:DNA repair exonuclease SbcCD nuclease subunit